MELDFHVNVVPVDQALAGADRLLQKNTKAFVRDAGKLTAREVRERMPVFDGEARDSVDHTTGGVGTTAFALIYTNADQSKMQTIEEGREPGSAPPPARALLPWVQRKFGGDMHDAFMLAQKIGRMGSHDWSSGGLQPFGKGFLEAVPMLEAMAMDIVNVF